MRVGPQHCGSSAADALGRVTARGAEGLASRPNRFWRQRGLVARRSALCWAHDARPGRRGAVLLLREGSIPHEQYRFGRTSGRQHRPRGFVPNCSSSSRQGSKQRSRGARRGGGTRCGASAATASCLQGGRAQEKRSSGRKRRRDPAGSLAGSGGGSGAPFEGASSDIDRSDDSAALG